MNSASYVRTYLLKLEMFRKHGFIPGYNLITTFEYYDEKDSKNNIIFSSGDAERIVREWFLPEGVILRGA